MTAIRKHLVDFAAIIALIVVAFGVAAVILANQRLALPAWVPFVGEDFVEVDAELSSAQAVTPGQGQTVNVAGVEVGEISRVRLEDGKAIVTLKLRKGAVPVYKDATVLLRPKTGLKDMVAELTPGTPDAGALPHGERIPISQTQPDVNLDEILASLDGDTRAFLELLLVGRRARACAATPSRSPTRSAASSRSRATPAPSPRSWRAGRSTSGASSTTSRCSSRSSAARTTSSPSSCRTRTPSSRCSRRQDAEPARHPGGAAVDADRDAQRAGQDGPARARARARRSRTLRPRRARSARRCSEVRPSCARRRRSSRTRSGPFVRAARPTVTQLQPALADLSAVAPDLLTLLQDPQRARQHARLQPARRERRGLPLLGLVAQPPRAHAVREPGRPRPAPARARADLLPEPGAARQRHPAEPAARRAHAAPRHAAALRRSARARPCPDDPGGRLMQKSAPSFGRIAAMVVFTLSCFALVLFLWLAFGGPIPLKPKGYRVSASFAEASQLATEADVRISGVPVGKVKAIEPDARPGARW